MEDLENQVEELRRKQRKLSFVLGDLLYALYRSQNIRFLYTSSGVSQEKEVEKMMKLLDYISVRIKKLEAMEPAENLKEKNSKKGA